METKLNHLFEHHAITKEEFDKLLLISKRKLRKRQQAKFYVIKKLLFRKKPETMSERASKDPLFDQLLKLKSSFDQHLIEEKEYMKQKNEILNVLYQN